MRKLTLKPIITAVLTAAILVTSINTGYVTTVNAATTTDTFTDGGTVTVKPGDVKNLLVQDDTGKDITNNYKWSSSDTNIVKVSTDLYYGPKGYTNCIELVAVSSGTVTITGKYKFSDEAYYSADFYDPNRPDLTMTVKVTMPKMTAKQKKCKHKYKVTKKATCALAGIKTCKKCKWQKTLSKTDHKWIDTEVTRYAYTEQHIRVQCWGCYCPEVTYRSYDWHHDTGTKCEHPCGKVFTTEEYGTVDALKAAMLEHTKTGCNGCRGEEMWGEYMGGPMKETTVTVTVCKYCGTEKE